MKGIVTDEPVREMAEAAGYKLIKADELTSLQAENERLREALDKIKGGHFENAGNLAIAGQWHAMFDALQAIARAALTHTQEQGGC